MSTSENARSKTSGSFISSHRLKFWIGLIISAIFLWLALRKVDWASVWQAWRMAKFSWLAAGTFLLVCSWGISAARWRILLAPSPGLRIRDTFAYITIGYLANTVLPLRLGDMARATMIGRNKGLGISRSLGSMAFERVLDLLTLLVITFALTFLMEIPPVIQAGIASMTILAISVLIFLVAMTLNRKRLAMFTQLLARIIPQHLAERVTTLATNFVSGVDVVHRPLRLVAVIGLSVGVWICTGLATWVWVSAFHLAVPWYAPLFVLVVINLGSAIPSSPGYVGVYHYLAVLALSVWNVEHGPALAYAFGTHALNMLANVSLGSFFLAREGVSLQSISHADSITIPDEDSDDDQSRT